MDNPNNLKVLGTILFRATDQLKLIIGEPIYDGIYKRVFDTLFDVLEPVYKRGLIENYKIKCNEEINPNICDTLELIAQFSVKFENENWIDMEYHIGPDFKITIRYVEPPQAEFIPITYCVIDKDGNVKPLEDKD